MWDEVQDEVHEVLDVAQDHEHGVHLLVVGDAAPLQDFCPDQSVQKVLVEVPE